MNLTEFQEKAATLAIAKLLTHRYFSICDFDAIAKSIGRPDACSGPDYQALRNLHCVEWGDMGPDLARMTRETALRLLGARAEIIEGAIKAASEGDATPASKPTGPRLAWWKR